ncbi:MAG: ion transporter [Proteobacteria bacterium]|nr:ion transporter [Pseudomonadota bacterium]
MWRRILLHALDSAGAAPGARWFRAVQGTVAFFGVGVVLAGSIRRFAAEHELALTVSVDVVLLLFVAEYVVRLAIAPRGHWGESEGAWAARLRWAVSPPGLIDLLAVLPMGVAMAAAADPRYVRLFGVLWLVKLARHFPGLAILGRVIRNASEPLLSVFVGFVIVLIVAASLAHVLEGEAQPNTFGNIPSALWWTIVTLTTVGYGDVVPVTPLGRVLGGVVMVCGIAVFAMWAGILATAFAEETRRLHFLRTWDLVAKVPYFRQLGAGLIADVARLLKTDVVPSGATVMRRGEPGDCMYFIVSGEIEVRLGPRPLPLGPGDFFGEIALVTGGPRTATAVATTETTLLALDIADFRALAARQPELAKVIADEAAVRLGQLRSQAPEPLPGAASATKDQRLSH